MNTQVKWRIDDMQRHSKMSIYMKPRNFGSQMASAGKRMIRRSPANIDRSSQASQRTVDSIEQPASRPPHISGNSSGCLLRNAVMPECIHRT